MSNGGFGQFCPVAMACEIFAERWTPIVLRELLAGAHHFNEIHRCIPLMSRTLLSRRLRELEGAGIITSAPVRKGKGREYLLTEAGREFRAALEALGAWGQRWTARVQEQNLDAGVLMWNMRRRIAVDRLPPRRTVVYFNYTGFPASYRGPKKFWLILERSGVDVCLSDTGFEVDLYVEADIATMVSVWLGDIGFAEAVRTKKIELTGMHDVARRFPSWLLLSHFASVPRPPAPLAAAR